ncbi:ATP-dependent Clp protease ATP-binding subunit [Candidatus Parcubacteria bacterium]|jgi:ATP-dependent Clp protease ATP-binding subunit ClpC|nr:MAG: ATP-dependent Clp protease ATP-binding subunit [Candidatus Parcubacteria bacterium]
MKELFYKEPRLLLSATGEFFVRLVSYSVYAGVGISAFFLILSENASERSLGILLSLFIIDRLFHIRHGERTIYELKKGNKNVALSCSPQSYHILNYSLRKAIVLKKSFNLILLLELLGRRDIKEALRRLGVKSVDMQKKTEALLETKDIIQEANKEYFLKNIESLVIVAFQNAIDTGEQYTHPRNLFVALSISGDSSVAKVFDLFNLEEDTVQEAIIFGKWGRMFFGIRRIPAVLGGFIHRPMRLRKRVINRSWTARPTPMLDQFSTDLTEFALQEKIGFLIGHNEEMNVLLHTLSRPGKQNVVLVGDPGAGKSSMVAHLAYRMVKDDVPSGLYDKRLVSLDIPALVANTNTEVLIGRLREITDEVILAGNIVLHIPELHNLFRTSTERGGINAVDILLPIIKSETIPVIGESFPREFKTYIEPRTDFLDQFDVVSISEISEKEAIRFLVYQSLLLEKQFRIFITFRAIERSVKIAHRYFHEKLLPGSASDLLKQALMTAKEERKKVLEEEDIIRIAEMQTRIPIETAGALEAEKLLNLEELIHKKLINQNPAVSSVSRSLREYRSGLSRKGGPIATFLFVGPTGVGKTELAKILNKIQFGSGSTMIRFDMSEYQDKQSISRFIGSSDGERSGALTDAVLKTPYSLVLLDEFEKAHPDILNLFLQVFDDGRLTDNLGRVVNFENTIIIATSNAHSEFIKNEIEKGRKSEEIAEDVKRKLTDYFKPELINRFSDIIVFRSLTPDETKQVTKLLMGEVINTLRESQGVDLVVDDSALSEIARIGYSPAFGARPLRQTISENIRSVLAEKILRREIVRGHVTTVSFVDNSFVWSNEG